MSEITEQELVLKYTFDVTSADCDRNARLRLGGLINYLILAAIRSADTLGFGFDGLRSQQLFWVLSRMTVEIYKPMKWCDTAFVETWPKDVDGLLYLRDFIVKDQRGKLVAKCTSGWLAIDIQTKRPRKVDEKFSYIFDHMKERNALDYRPEKLASVEPQERFDVRTTWFDLDLNKHVTSTRYVDWMIDALPFDFLDAHYPSRLSIKYMKETMHGEVITLKQASTNENQFSFEGVNRAGDSVKFRGMVDF